VADLNESGVAERMAALIRNQRTSHINITGR